MVTDTMGIHSNGCFSTYLYNYESSNLVQFSKGCMWKILYIVN